MIDDHRLARLHHLLRERRKPEARRRGQHARRELAENRLLVTNDVPPRRLLEIPAFVLHDHAAVVAEPRQGEMHGAIERLLVIERRRQQRADIGEKRQPIARRHGFVERGPLARDEILPQTLGVEAVADVARDLRCADDGARGIDDR